MSPTLPWCAQVRMDKPFRLVTGSYIDDRNNHVDIITRALEAGQGEGDARLH